MIDTYAPIKSQSLYVFIVGILRLVIQLIILLLAHFFLRKTYRQSIKLIDNKTSYIICIYSIIIVLYLFENFDFETNTFAYNGFMNILLLAFFVFSGYTIVGITIKSISKTLTLEHDLRIIENQINMQRNNYEALNKAIERYSILKHDIRHHTLAVKSILQTGNCQEAIKYIELFTDSKILKDIPMVCKNLVVDSFVKYYMSIASDKNIKFNTQLNISQDININPTDLCVILGNGIENAINACDRMGDDDNKYINLFSNIVGSNLVIRIVNSYSGKIKKDGDKFISTTPEGHGIGLLSISTLAEKYNGYVDIKYTHNRFEIDIVLNTET